MIPRHLLAHGADRRLRLLEIQRFAGFTVSARRADLPQASFGDVQGTGCETSVSFAQNTPLGGHSKAANEGQLKTGQ